MIIPEQVILVDAGYEKRINPKGGKEDEKNPITGHRAVPALVLLPG